MIFEFSHLTFAYDILIFPICLQDCLNAIKDFLSEYQTVCSQRVNVNKSSFFTSSWANTDHVQLVSFVLGFQKQEFPFTYFRAPIYKVQLGHVLFDGIVAKMRSRLMH